MIYRRNVLIVDDQAPVSRAIARRLALRVEGTTITTSLGFRAARVLLGQSRYDLIISDYNTNDRESGPEFLQWAGEKYSDIGRMIMSDSSHSLDESPNFDGKFNKNNINGLVEAVEEYFVAKGY
jgi:DNA-binding NtrC family response regulator